MTLPAIVVAVALSLTAAQFPPPNIVENGDARGAESSWTKDEKRPGRMGRASMESCETGPCFVVRDGANWAQFPRLPEGSVGKFVLVIGRGSSERVWPKHDNITGVPYLQVAFATASRTRYIYVDNRNDAYRGNASQPNQWVTMSSIKRIPAEAAFLWLQLGQGERKGTPHNGSAARFMDVEARIFDTEDAARAYIEQYNEFHATGR
jgi:hypothetical protein